MVAQDSDVVSYPVSALDAQQDRDAPVSTDMAYIVGGEGYLEVIRTSERRLVNLAGAAIRSKKSAPT